MLSHAGSLLLRELAAECGLLPAVSGALSDTCKGVPVRAPGQVFADLAVAIADCVSEIGLRGDRRAPFGP